MGGGIRKGRNRDGYDMKYKCPKCDRSYWGVYKKKTITEYRILNEDGTYEGNWKTEQTSDTKILGLRCMSCGNETDGSDIKGCSGVKIEKSKVLFITDFWENMGKDQE